MIICCAPSTGSSGWRGGSASNSTSIWHIDDFVGLDSTDVVPDHSSFSKSRHGRLREADLLRRVFETVLRRCIREVGWWGGLCGRNSWTECAATTNSGLSYCRQWSRLDAITSAMTQ
jgi:transposase-like protein DUF772